MNIDNNIRFGRFTSSQIGNLMTKARNGKDFGAPALDYIETRDMERGLHRSISQSMSSRETSWGHLCELYLFDQLGLDYNLVSQETIVHPTIPTWAGSPDGKRFIAEPTVFDAKCPFTLKSFCTLVKSWRKGGIDLIRKNHKEGDKYYWQLVSNAILTDSTHAELIVFAPYKDELDKIRILAMDAPPEVAGRYKWLDYASDSELPYLVRDGEYKNINIMRFPVPQADKDALTDAVLRAEATISGEPPLLIASQAEQGVTLISKG